MKKKLQSVFRKTLTIISPVLNTKVCYRVKFGKPIDLNNPKTFDEKILYLKLKDFETNELVRQCADKYRVREYIEKCGCSEILVDLIASYDSVNDIEWEKLPSKFAMKLNVGCGCNIICTDKSKLDINDCIVKLTKWVKKKQYLGYSEMQYKDIKPQIIVEKYLDDGSGVLPIDYKIACFNGKAEYLMICVGRETGHASYYYFDRDWNVMHLEKDEDLNLEHNFKRPDCLEELFEYADILAKPFAFVRADFYIVNNKIYFGELTFTPSGGMDTDLTDEAEQFFGRMIDIHYRKRPNYI